MDHVWEQTGGLSWTCHACGAHMVMLVKGGPAGCGVADGRLTLDYLSMEEKTEVMAACELELVRQVMEG